MTRRRGTGLPELLVALTLTGVVLATASRGLLQHLRQQRDRDAQARAENVVRDVMGVLRSELAHASGESMLLGDTAMQLSSLRTSAIGCDLVAARLVIPSDVGWWSAPKAGDSVAVTDTLTGLEWRAGVTATGTQHASSRCPAGGTRVTLSAVPPPSVPILLVPSRIWRTVRYTVYRASDGLWWLGERNCTPGCGAAQPIAGPVLSPSQAGLRLSVVRYVDGIAAAIDLSVRVTLDLHTAAGSARLPLATVR